MLAAYERVTGNKGAARIDGVEGKDFKPQLDREWVQSYVSLIKKAREIGYETNLLYFWLASPEFAKLRVAGRVSAAQNAAIIYSLLATCKLHDVNAYDWLKYVITAMPTFPSSRIKELLPHNWKGSTIEI